MFPIKILRISTVKQEITSKLNSRSRHIEKHHHVLAAKLKIFLKHRKERIEDPKDSTELYVFMPLMTTSLMPK